MIRQQGMFIGSLGTEREMQALHHANPVTLLVRLPVKQDVSLHVRQAVKLQLKHVPLYARRVVKPLVSQRAKVVVW